MRYKERPQGKESKTDSLPVVSGFDKDKKPIISCMSPEDAEKILRGGKIEILGPLENFFEIEPHQNLISAILVEIVDPENKNDKILGIYKFYEGEGWGLRSEFIQEFLPHEKTLSFEIKAIPGNAKIGTPWENVAYYPREIFASIVDKQLGFNIIPPTVYREINFDPPIVVNGIEYTQTRGSLQAFIAGFTLGKLMKIQKSNFLNNFVNWLLENPEIFYKISILEYLLASTRRREEDIIIQLEDDKIQRVFLIDNGNTCLEDEIILSRVSSLPNILYMWAISNILGTNRYIINLSEEAKKIQKKISEIRKNKEIIIPLVEQLKNLLNNREKLKQELEAMGLTGMLGEIRLITEEDLAGFFERLERLVQALENDGGIPINLSFELMGDKALIPYAHF